VLKNFFYEKSLSKMFSPFKLAWNNSSQSQIFDFNFRFIMNFKAKFLVIKNYEYIL